MGKPNSGTSYSKAGIARTDRPCYWVSPCGWELVGLPEIVVVVVVVVAVVVVESVTVATVYRGFRLSLIHI